MMGSNLQAWRVARRLSPESLAEKAGCPMDALQAMEDGTLDPPLSLLEKVAGALGIPPSWLFGHPKQVDLLTGDPDGDPDEDGEFSAKDSVDPVIERILLGTHIDRELYILLTALLRSGDPKLLRAAEVSLRSLVKQSKQATLPWQNRQPGNFEPPSD
jgi:transcriptional regulator with XRE-family HTH domain